MTRSCRGCGQTIVFGVSKPPVEGCTRGRLCEAGETTVTLAEAIAALSTARGLRRDFEWKCNRTTVEATVAWLQGDWLGYGSSVVLGCTEYTDAAGTTRTLAVVRSRHHYPEGYTVVADVGEGASRHVAGVVIDTWLVRPDWDPRRDAAATSETTS